MSYLGPSGVHWKTVWKLADIMYYSTGESSWRGLDPISDMKGQFMQQLINWWGEEAIWQIPYNTVPLVRDTAVQLGSAPLQELLFERVKRRPAQQWLHIAQDIGWGCHERHVQRMKAIFREAFPSERDDDGLASWLSRLELVLRNSTGNIMPLAQPADE